MIKYFSFLIIFSTSSSFACCANDSYRLFPIAELNKSVLLLEVKTFKNCKHDYDKKKQLVHNEIWVRSVFNLVQYKNDSILLIENLDSTYSFDCEMKQDSVYSQSEYEKLLSHYYLMAIDKMKSLKSKLIKSISVELNDTLNTTIVDDFPDYRIQYKNYLNFNLDSIITFQCDTDQVSQVRTFKSKSYIITVVTLSCHPTPLSAILHKKNRFKSIKTAYWKEQLITHGTIKDYIFIESHK